MTSATTNGINQILVPDSICWVCGPASPDGLRLAHQRTDTGVSTQWWASQRYEGAPGRLHNGFAAALLEDTVGWAAMSALHEDRGALTPVRILDLHVTFHGPIPSRRGLTLIGRVTAVDAGVAYTMATLSDSDEILATAESRMAFTESAGAAPDAS